jgi:hypothetical protein
MLNIINMTLRAVGEDSKSGIVMYPGRYHGAKELLSILQKEKKFRDTEVNKLTYDSSN